MTFVLLSLADAKDCGVKDNFPLKQEGGEDPQAQGEGAGKCLHTLPVYYYDLDVSACCINITKFLGVSAPSSSLKDQASADPQDSDAEKSEGTPLKGYF